MTPLPPYAGEVIGRREDGELLGKGDAGHEPVGMVFPFLQVVQVAISHSDPRAAEGGALVQVEAGGEAGDGDGLVVVGVVELDHGVHGLALGGADGRLGAVADQVGHQAVDRARETTSDGRNTR